jgi:hypothetical protein
MPRSLTTHDMSRQPTNTTESPVTPPSILFRKSSFETLALKNITGWFLLIRLASAENGRSRSLIRPGSIPGSTATNDAQCRLGLGDELTLLSFSSLVVRHSLSAILYSGSDPPLLYLRLLNKDTILRPFQRIPSTDTYVHRISLHRVTRARCFGPNDERFLSLCILFSY